MQKGRVKHVEIVIFKRNKCFSVTKICVNVCNANGKGLWVASFVNLIMIVNTKATPATTKKRVPVGLNYKMMMKSNNGIHMRYECVGCVCVCAMRPRLRLTHTMYTIWMRLLHTCVRYDRSINAINGLRQMKTTPCKCRLNATYTYNRTSSTLLATYFEIVCIDNRKIVSINGFSIFFLHSSECTIPIVSQYCGVQ